MEECREDNTRATAIYLGLTETQFFAHRPAAIDEKALRLALQPNDVAVASLFVIGLPLGAQVPDLFVYPSHQR